MNWKRPFAKLLSKHRETTKLLALREFRNKASYLETVGWFESHFSRMAVDRECKPIPWLTYPSIAFLGQRLNKNLNLFEYGSGNSTLWWADHVSQVTSCEHDRSWYDKIAPRLPSNAQYIYSELGSGYSSVISQYDSEFDVVVIDGRERVQCARNALSALNRGGVIIWDNSDREKYLPGIHALQEAGFRRIDFYGMVPIATFESCTSIFYRSENCFDI
jgi:hypothetical protein